MLMSSVSDFYIHTQNADAKRTERYEKNFSRESKLLLIFGTFFKIGFLQFLSHSILRT